MPAPNQHLITHLNSVEYLLLVLLSFSVTLLTWFGFEDLNWIIGFTAVLGLFTPLLFKTHLEASEFIHYQPWRNWLKVIWPALVLLGMNIVSLFFPVSEEIQIGGETYSVLLTGDDRWLPAQVDWSSSFNTYGGFVGMYILTSSLLFIPRTKLFFQRFMEVVFINNFFICFVYLISSALQTVGVFDELLISNPSSFANSDAWAGYMTLWILMNWGFFLSKFRVRRQDHTILDNPRTVLPMTAMAVASVIYHINAWQAVCFFGGLTVGLWHYTGLLRRTSKRKGAKHKLKWLSSHAATFACVAGVVWGGIAIVTSVTADTSEETATLIPESNMEASLRMIAERPLTGWGIESFQKIGSYFAEPNDALITYPDSDLISYLVQFGFLGFIIMAWTPLSQVFKYFRKRSRSSVNDYALLAILLATLFGVGAMPTAHFGYIFLWLVVMFSGIRWADIIHEEALREEKYQTNVRDFTQTPFQKRPLSTT